VILYDPGAYIATAFKTEKGKQQRKEKKPWSYAQGLTFNTV
jgi:hypothetical protein